MSTATATVTCGSCRRSFAEDRAQPACRSCPLKSGCTFVRCPYCGYDNPVEPPWLTKLRTWWRLHEAG
jgi:predicted amidophosphoribosyltransferase